MLPGRARARLPGLRGNPALAAGLERTLRSLPAVLHATTNPITGSVLVLYDARAAGPADVAAWVQAGANGAGVRRYVAAAAESAAAPKALGAGVTPSGGPPPAAIRTRSFAGQTGPACRSEAGPACRSEAGPAGLTAAAVSRQRAASGPNLLPPPHRPPLLRRLLDQYRDAMQLTLAAGAGLSWAAGHRRDALTMGAVLLLNGLIGAQQAGRAPAAAGALAGLAAAPVRVVRDGAEQVVPAADLVPGDLLLLAAGDRLPADARVAWGAGLAVDEGLLTGECAAVEKSPGDGLHAGTAVVRGRCRAQVTATGAASSLGRIAALLAPDRRPAPLQQRLDGLGRGIARAAAWLAAGATGVGLLRGQGPVAALLAGVSLAISAVPEGLPAFVTLALASGARRMAGRGAAVHHLAAVEAMGSMTALCLDKTGTITGGELTVAELVLPDARWEVTGRGYWPAGEFHRDGRLQADPLADPTLRRLLKAAALCTDARLGVDERGALVTSGDPTEVAILVAALKAGLRAAGGEGDRVREYPFDPVRRRMTVVCREGPGQAVACTKGAPEAVLPLCTRAAGAGGLRALDRRLRRRLERAAGEMAGRGLRVLAVACRPVPLHGRAEPGQDERDLVLLGLIGLDDPPRPGAARAIGRLQQAGIRCLMVTGDHPATAAAVARQVGLGGGAVLTGPELSALPAPEWQRALAGATVVARVTPEQKLQAVQALRRLGHVVAVAGDGVNDAPAMRAADAGIAPADRATDVTRAVACITLKQDDLEILAGAVAEGRATGRNIRRMARYLLGSNAAETCLLAASLALGLPLALLPVQLLWLNLVGDVLPAAALGGEPPPPDALQRTAPPGGDLPGPRFGRQVLGHGLRTGLAATGAYAWALAAGRPVAAARTLAMATLAGAQVRHLLACGRREPSRSGHSASPDQGASAGPAPSAMPPGMLTPQVSRPVAAAAAAAGTLAMGAIYLPPLRRVLQFAPLGPADLALAAGLALLPGVGGGSDPGR